MAGAEDQGRGKERAARRRLGAGVVAYRLPGAKWCERENALHEPLLPMSDQSKPAGSPLSPSPAKASAKPDEGKGAQLSPRPGVDKSVSSTAMDRGALIGAMRPPLSADLPQVVAAADASSDAEVMLRGRAGDEPLFHYLW